MRTEPSSSDNQKTKQRNKHAIIANKVVRHENKHATKHTNKKCTAKNYEYSENYELSLEATNMQGRATKQRMSVQKR